MKVRTKFASAGVAAAMLAGYTFISAAPSGASVVDRIDLVCDEVSEEPAFEGLELAFIVSEVTPVPDNAYNGDVVPIDLEFGMELSGDIKDIAESQGITEVNVSDLVLNLTPSGGGSGAQIDADKTDFTLDLASGLPHINFNGDVTIDDETKPTILSVNDPITLTVSLIVFDQPLSIDLSCEVNPVGVVSINGALPPPKTTTTTTAAPTTTTTIDTSTSTRSASVPLVCSYDVSPKGTVAELVKSQVGPTLNIVLEVTSEVPKQAANGSTVPVSFDMKMAMAPNMLAMAKQYNISQIQLTDISMGVQTSGGGSGGPFMASWGGSNGYTVDVASGAVPSGKVSGTVTVTDSSQPILFSVLNPVRYTVNIKPSGLAAITMVNTCTPASGAYVASINGALPEGPAGGVGTRPGFAG